MPSAGLLTKPGVRRHRRRLPRPVAPFPKETLASYLRRLEIANGLPTDRTGISLGIRRGDDISSALSELTGRPVRVLQFALPELRSSARRVTPMLRDEPTRPHWACDLCCRRAGINVPVRRWAIHDEVVCLRHRRWLGSAVEDTAEQLDLSAHADVLDARRRHRNLISRSGRVAVHDVYETSARVVWEWQCQGRRIPSVNARLDRLRAGKSCTYLDAELHAALYPAAVALTSLLASPQWRRLAFNADDTCVQRFLQEVAATVADGYYPAGGLDPLRHHLVVGSSGLRVIPMRAIPLASLD